MYLTDNAKLMSNIKRIATKRVELENLIQDTGVGALFQALKHKNINTANELCRAVKGGMKVQALTLWLIQFGPFKAGGKKDQEEGRYVLFDKAKMPADDEDMDARLRAAAAKPWHSDDTEQPAYKYMSIANEIHALIKKIEEPKENVRVVRSDKDTDALDALRALAAAMPKVDLKAVAKADTEVAA